MGTLRSLSHRLRTCLFPSANATNHVTGHTRLGHSVFICYNNGVYDTTNASAMVWGPYPNYDDIARFEYGRRLWRSPAMRLRLLNHWTDARHPHRDRFGSQRDLIEEVLNSADSPEALDNRLRGRGTSLRCVAREIPPVFGSFF
jgi:hypothetical protein